MNLVTTIKKEANARIRAVLSFLVSAALVLTMVPVAALSAATEAFALAGGFSGPRLVTIHKVDENGNPLSGAKFHIEDAKGNAVSFEAYTSNGELLEADANGSVTTPADGTIIYSAVSFTPSGKYTVVEDNAPEGYEIEGNGRADFMFDVDASQALYLHDAGLIDGVYGTSTSGGRVVGTGSLEFGSAPAFCVTPQALFLFEDEDLKTTDRKEHIYSTISESQVNLSVFGEKNKVTRTPGWMNPYAFQTNSNLTPEKIEQIKKILWATYGFMTSTVDDDWDKDITGIIKENLGKHNASAAQASVYWAVEAAIAEIVTPGVVKPLGNNESQGNVGVLYEALVSAAKGGAYFAGYSAFKYTYTLTYLQSNNPDEQNLIVPGPAEVTISNKKKSETPKIETNAHSRDDGSSYSVTADKITVIDTVSYSGLTPGKEYTLKAQVIRKSDGKVISENVGVQGSTTGYRVQSFTPTSSSGTINIDLVSVINKGDGVLKEGDLIVVFEELYDENNTLVATHKDINDANQTVSYGKPSIKTTAKDKATGAQKVKAGEDITIVDTVAYEKLIPGQTYTIKGSVVTKDSNGKDILVTAEKTFKISGSEGFTEVKAVSGTEELTFPAFNSAKLAGSEVVVFEELYDANDKLIAQHKDTNDKGQTVTIEEEEKVNVTADKKWLLNGEEIDWPEGHTVTFALGTIVNGVFKALTNQPEITLSNTGQKAVWENLPKLASGDYVVKEVKVDGDYAAMFELVDKDGVAVSGQFGGNATIHNKVKTTEVEVTKKWINGEILAAWPEGVEVEVVLLKDGSKYDSATLSASHPAHKFTNLPDVPGVSYTVEEAAVIITKDNKVINSYTTHVTSDKTKNSFVISNTPNKTDIKISKDSITGVKQIEGATLTITGTDVFGNAVNLSKVTEAGKAWEVKLAEGNYTLTETSAPAGYLVAESINFAITTDKGGNLVCDTQNGDIHMVDAIETTELTVEKTWKNPDGSTTWPKGASVDVELVANGKGTGKLTVLTEGNTTFTWKDLPKYEYDAQGKKGNEIAYSAQETAVTGVVGYTTTVTTNGNKTTITNDKQPGTVKVSKTDINGTE
ncbi:MAG: VaFE repeat-containing surface-anchored protein, partial [Eggerthellaceae bacterium]|nr:VaFE repeat-containing surface-anchored protein [Eggerthellaceae bacterium]